MKARSALLGTMLCAVSTLAFAQRADCPKPDVPMPTNPPAFADDPSKADPNAEFLEAEEGHVSAILQMARRVRPGPLPSSADAVAVDVLRTPLALWNYLGYLPSPMRSRVTRFFGKEGSLLALSEWAYRGDMGGDLPASPDVSNRTIGGRPAGLHGLRSPSGCVSTTLSWKDDNKLWRIEIVGPLSIEKQRTTVMQIGEAIAR
jgi:hypothetical protein